MKNDGQSGPSTGDKSVQGETGPEPLTGKAGQYKFLFRAFRHRNYRLYFLGQSLSLVGVWMQQIAVGWLVYRLTGSAMQLGVVAFASQIPVLLLTPFAGLLADRMNRRRLLIWTQSLALLQALLLTLLVFSSHAQVWQIALLSLANGVINSFDMPARHSFVADLVEREDLANAIPLNSVMFNSARLIGPSLAGIIIARYGEGVCFLLNAASYLAVLAALCAMRMGSAPPAPANGRRVFEEIVDGFRCAWNCFPIRAILLFLCLLSIAVMPYTTLLPAFARDVLNAGSTDYGFMVTASGVGCLICNFFFASRRDAAGLVRFIPATGAATAAGIFALSMCPSLPLSFPLLFLLGGVTMAQLTASNVMLQTVVDGEKRGRIMSLYIMAFIGMVPVGSLLAGAIAERLGIALTMRGGSYVFLAGSLLFLAGLPRLRRELRVVYRRQGIPG